MNKYIEAFARIKAHSISAIKGTASSPYNDYLNSEQPLLEDLKIIEELIDKETAMKPAVSFTTFKTRRGKGYHIYTIKTTRCPKCNEDVKESYLGRMKSSNYNYCYKCGQKLDWSEEDE